MDLELENLKNDFLPLITGIKQEQLDSVASDVLPQQNHLPITAATTSTSSSSSSSVGNPCDSAEKRVSYRYTYLPTISKSHFQRTLLPFPLRLITPKQATRARLFGALGCDKKNSNQLNHYDFGLSYLSVAYAGLSQTKKRLLSRAILYVIISHATTTNRTASKNKRMLKHPHTHTHTETFAKIVFHFRVEVSCCLLFGFWFCRLVWKAKQICNLYKAETAKQQQQQHTQTHT